MPDITMCKGGGCPSKARCYRAIAKPCEYRQSYFCAPPYDPQTGVCEYLWDIEGSKIIRAKAEEQKP